MTLLVFWGGVENIPEVQRSKLTEEEKNYLEQPLTIEELDASIKKQNQNLPAESTE